MTDHRASWIAALAKLTTPHDPERAAQAMAAYLPFLLEFPVHAFTLDSMRHVAMQDRRMMIPDLREVLTPLTQHWAMVRPPRAAPRLSVVPVEPERREPTAEERAAVSAKVAEATAALRSRDSERTPPKLPRPHYAPPEALAEARAQLAARARP